MRSPARRARSRRQAPGPGLLLTVQPARPTPPATRRQARAVGYCHVPNGSTKDMRPDRGQVERFAPASRRPDPGPCRARTAAMSCTTRTSVGATSPARYSGPGPVRRRPVLVRRIRGRTRCRRVLCSPSTGPAAAASTDAAKARDGGRTGQRRCTRRRCRRDSFGLCRLIAAVSCAARARIRSRKRGRTLDLVLRYRPSCPW